jgi:hypothetical protein
MSLYAAEKFIFLLKKDAALQEQFRADPAAALAAFELSPKEADALKGGDLPALYAMGLHPLLLAPYARFMKIHRPEYVAKLDPLRGTRKFRS